MAPPRRANGVPVAARETARCQRRREAVHLSALTIGARSYQLVPFLRQADSSSRASGANDFAASALLIAATSPALTPSSVFSAASRFEVRTPMREIWDCVGRPSKPLTLP